MKYYSYSVARSGVCRGGVRGSRYGSLQLFLRRRFAGKPLVVSSNGGGCFYGVGTTLCKRYWYVPPQRVWVLLRFGLKTGVHLSILVWNRGYGLLGNYGSIKTYLPFQYQGSKKLKKKFANSKWILKEIFFVGVLIYVMMTQLLNGQGPVSRKSRKLFGSKANFKIQTC